MPRTTSYSPSSVRKNYISSWCPAMVMDSVTLWVISPEEISRLSITVSWRGWARGVICRRRWIAVAVFMKATPVHPESTMALVEKDWEFCWSRQGTVRCRDSLVGVVAPRTIGLSAPIWRVRWSAKAVLLDHC